MPQDGKGALDLEVPPFVEAVVRLAMLCKDSVQSRPENDVLVAQGNQLLGLLSLIFIHHLLGTLIEPPNNIRQLLDLFYDKDVDAGPALRQIISLLDIDSNVVLNKAGYDIRTVISALNITPEQFQSIYHNTRLVNNPLDANY